MQNHLSNKPPVSFSLREKGQSLLEMAFSVIVLLLLIAVIVDLGRALFTWLALREAAEEGAVYASICPPLGLESQLVDAHIQASSHFPVDLTSDDIVIDKVWAQGATGTQIEVRVTHTNFKLITPLVGAFIGSDSIQIEGYAAAVALQYECPD